MRTFPPDPHDHEYNGPAAFAAALIIAAIIVIVSAIVWALVTYVNQVERDCIERHGVKYCREVMQ